MKYFASVLLTTSLIVALFNLRLYSQEPDLLWTKTYGGNEYDFGFSVKETIDGGFILCGGTGSFGLGGNGYTDAWLIKTNEKGDSLWMKTYGGIFSDDGFSVSQTTDGGYILGGDSYSFITNSTDVFLVKTDQNGDTLWTRTYGDTEADMCWAIQQTADTGYIVAGRTVSLPQLLMKIYLLKTDISGNILWEKIYGESSWDEAKAVRQTRDGGYIITGITYEGEINKSEIFLYKTDEYGDTVWMTIFGGSERDEGFDVKQTFEGGYIIVGRTESFGDGAMDVWLIKTDSSGNTEWTKTFGGSNDDMGFTVQQTVDSGYIIAGRTEEPTQGNGDILVIKTDVNGNEIWTKIISGIYNESGYSIQETADTGYVITGYTDSYGAGNADLWLIKLGDDVSSINISEGNIKNYKLNQNYPNPFNPITKIEYEIPERSFITIKAYDVLGNEVATLVNEEKPAGEYEFDLDGSRLTSGIYFYQLQAGSFVETKKMILLK